MGVPPGGQLYIARTPGSNSKLKIAKDSSPHQDNSGVKCLHGKKRNSLRREPQVRSRGTRLAGISRFTCKRNVKIESVEGAPAKPRYLGQAGYLSPCKQGLKTVLVNEYCNQRTSATRTLTSTRTLQNNRLNYRIQSLHVGMQTGGHLSVVFVRNRT